MPYPTIQDILQKVSYFCAATESGKVIIDPFRSLSRLKQLVIGKKTREDHPQVMNACIRLFASATEARAKLDNGFDLTPFDKEHLILVVPMSRNSRY